ncbi:PREDICTED: uncharacterized protein LOC109289246 [Gavialis gangeticus]|uniref:uncharacterized protein LOC109289246 n=1 Tax=Gavialis gangeticus TaxID=94835 RepID=UPI00092E8B33|nr:PREDICTED: uncharacterized protein LOC109289246 [Gavialis gangeticus]
MAITVGGAGSRAGVAAAKGGWAAGRAAEERGCNAQAADRAAGCQPAGPREGSLCLTASKVQEAKAQLAGAEAEVVSTRSKCSTALREAAESSAALQGLRQRTAEQEAAIHQLESLARAHLNERQQEAEQVATASGTPVLSSPVAVGRTGRGPGSAQAPPRHAPVSAAAAPRSGPGASADPGPAEGSSRGPGCRAEGTYLSLGGRDRGLLGHGAVGPRAAGQARLCQRRGAGCSVTTPRACGRHSTVRTRCSGCKMSWWHHR